MLFALVKNLVQNDILEMKEITITKKINSQKIIMHFNSLNKQRQQFTPLQS